MKCVDKEILVCVSSGEVISSYEQIKKKVSNEKIIDTKYLYLHAKSADNWAKREDDVKGIAWATRESFKKLIETEKFKEKIKNIQTIVDLGVGKGVKTIELIKKLNEILSSNQRNKHINVVCFDFSLEMIKKSATNLKEEINNNNNIDITIEGYKGDFMKINETQFASKDRNENILFMLLGGTLGNVNEKEFLESLSKTMQEGDIGILTFFNFDEEKINENGLENEYEKLVYSVYGPTISDLGYNLTDINIFFEKIDNEYFNVIAKVGLEDLLSGKYIDDVEVLQSKRYEPEYIKNLMKEKGFNIISEKEDEKGITTSILFERK